MSRYGLRSSSRRGRSSQEEEDSSRSAEETEQGDFSLTESGSGRTVAHLVTHLKEEHDFAITDSGRTLYYLSESEQADDVPSTTPMPVASGVPTQPRSAARPIPDTADSQGAGSQGSSASAFLSGIMNPRSGSQNNTPLDSNAQLVHSPPAAASYEARHFGKRIRSGSISQRLLSAADLEDIAVLDKHQKGILKDLIISGDEDLSYALEKYKQGDKATLENMMPALLNRAASENIDLLGELDEDLGFLAVGDHHDYSSIPVAHGGKIHPTAASVIEPMPAPAEAHTQLIAQPMPIPLQPPPSFPTKQQVQQMTSLNMGVSQHANKVSPATYEEDDGIGDLEFEGGLDVVEEYLLPTFGSNTSSKQVAHSPTTLEQQQRFRSNSLAFGALLNETPNSSDGKEMYGRWMDRQAPYDPTAALQQQQQQASQQQAQNVTSSSGAGVNAGLVLLDPSGRSGTMQQGRGQGGIGASLAQYGKSKSDSKLSTKAMMAEERRREKREKREQKEREKREKKERRELAMRERKEREAREKQEKKDKKAAAGKARQDKHEEEDERMETPSGLGMPRSMSDPNFTVSTDADGLLHVDRPEGWIGAYSPESRKMRIDRFLEKRNHRVWTKKVKYDVRKNFADSRLRVKGRFVKKEDELLMRDLMSLT